MRDSWLFIAFAIVGLSCTDLGTQSHQTLSIDLGRSIISKSVSFPVTIRNNGGEVFYIEMLCNDLFFELEQKTDAGWTRIYRPQIMRLCRSEVVPIRNDEVRTSSEYLSVSGLHRLMLRYGTDPNSALTDSVYSRAFVVQ